MNELRSGSRTPDGMTKGDRMNICEYGTTEKEQLYNFLQSIGFNETGITELMKRLEEDRPDRNDLEILDRYNEQKSE